MNPPKLNVILGVYCFITAVVSGTYYAITYHTGSSDFFWFCNLAFLIVAVGFFWQKNLLLTTVLIMAIPLQFFWIYADLLHLFGIKTIGRIMWMKEASTMSVLLSLHYHFIIIPLTAYGIWKYGYHRRGFTGAVIFYLFIGVTTVFLTDPVRNINCVFFPCDMDYRNPRIYDYGLWYMAWRLGYFMFISGVIHFVCLKLIPVRHKTPHP